MSELRLSYPASVIAGKLRIVPDDIFFLRKHMFPHGLTSASDVAQLLAIHRSCPEKCAEWDNWFVESITAFIVFHSWPQHSLDDINVNWLIGVVSRDGMIETVAELELVLHVIEVARVVPSALSVLALDQLRLALTTGQGAYAEGRHGKRRGIGREDIDHLYRVLRSSSQDGRMFLSHDQIAVLEAIDHAVGAATCHPAWHDLIAAITVRSDEGTADPVHWLRMLEEDLYGLDAA